MTKLQTQMLILGLETQFKSTFTRLLKNSSASVQLLWFRSAIDVDDLCLPLITEILYVRQISQAVVYCPLVTTPYNTLRLTG